MLSFYLRLPIPRLGSSSSAVLLLLLHIKPDSRVRHNNPEPPQAGASQIWFCHWFEAVLESKRVGLNDLEAAERHGRVLNRKR